MAFYLKPPVGSVPLDKLQNFVMKRLSFLYYIHDHTVEDVMKVIVKEALAKNSECLIEGTVKDKISHFTLRFLCVSDSLLQEFLIQSETKLFSYRLQFCDFARLQQLVQKTSEQSKVILSNNNFILKSYRKILTSLIFITEELKFAAKENRDFIEIPFTTGLKFVRERSYPLHLGFIKLPLTDIKSLLIYLFEELLTQGLDQIKMSSCVKGLDDPRMQYISQKIQEWIHSKLHPVKTYYKPISECNLLNISKKFPLCMYNLHNMLLKHHRLKHISRIQYTLFLKDIGVPSDEVIKLFRKEYSVPFVHASEIGHSHCPHSWTESEKRYIYSIEHLYGMRGSRKNYKAHTCNSLQSSYDSEGGCPFFTFDDDHLQEILKNENLLVPDIEDVVSLVHKNKYHEACCFYLKCKVYMHQNDIKQERDFQNSTMFKKRNNCSHYSKNINSNLNCEKHELFSFSSLKINRPSDFYSILNFYLDEQLLPFSSIS